ncbi:MAG: addiction module protein [Pseudomonadota bacterium]|nr:addiction module protein [Pseudomonadota bacterium]
MARSVVDFFDEASKLDEHDRATLAGLLLESIEHEPDPDVEEAWKREIARRIGELDSGSVSLVPWEEVKAKLFRAASDES